ncbi:AP-3 complex subunit beta-2 [Chrysoperla carnea]|uniref:AP-3 complex subunit beta-2 n=1 Tax=Chrysoperla carnea TaxID=189513 RepID=UPI001D0855C2|nr:AP-3 complex subunit beta-2 [Chrysoperla carnea]
MLSLGTMANNNGASYGNDRNSSSAELEYGQDPTVTGSFFSSDYKKHDDLKEMLDSNKDSLKLEAMKRIIGMIAKGRDASELFPAVVKNVVSKNIEVKKLVYVYLVRYAEEQQDLALLCISTFQRALKDPNQLIRAGALRVLSSIRVSMIVPIVMLAIRDASVDMSPYVRKTAAHAIPKLYSLDPEQKIELVDVIERLLGDRTTLVVGSAVMAFEEVCPDRIDLIHRNYRKLCSLLVDVDEWGQVVIINMLTRYARTQFVDPNLHDKMEDAKSFYDTSDDDDSSDNEDSTGAGGAGDGSTTTGKQTNVITMDSDHRLLLRTTRPLLQSRNASVVMAVVQLYHHCAPRQEVSVAIKALIRLLRSYPEVQSIVLNAIVSISVQRKGMFEPYLKSFFVRTSDLTHIKLLKLEILTNLATEGNVSMILCELQTYISSSDKKFVAAAIQAIGRCACNIQEITDTCLNGLVSLLSSKDEAIVAESVVVIKRLLQSQAAEPGDIITHMARLLDSITIPQARAAILWLLGENSSNVKKIAPDVLRKLAKSFVDEHDIVKLQVLNLAVKLWLTNREQTALLCQYVFSLARYDQSYDIRDRARFLRHFTVLAEGKILPTHAPEIFLQTKAAPQLNSTFKDREQFQLGSLSHYINAPAAGYRELPPFATTPTSSALREVDTSSTENTSTHTKQKKIFYSDTEEASSAAEYNSSKDSDSDEEEDEEGSNSGESDSDDSENKGSNSGEEKSGSNSSEEGSSDESDNDSESDSDATSSEEKYSAPSTDEEPNNTTIPPASKKTTRKKSKSPEPKNNLDLLLDLDFNSEVAPVMTPSIGGFLSPIQSTIMPNKTATADVQNIIQTVAPKCVPQTTHELLNRIKGNGLSVTYRFTRSPHLFSPQMASVELIFTNGSNQEITDIHVGQKHLPVGTFIHDFATIGVLHPDSSLPGTLGVNFNDSTQPISFEIVSSAGSSLVNLRCPVGELIQAVTMSESNFAIELNRLRGMYEHTAKIHLTPTNEFNLDELIYKAANVSAIESTDQILRYTGRTLSSASLLLLNISKTQDQMNLTVNCEKIMIASMLLDEIVTNIKQYKK